MDEQMKRAVLFVNEGKTACFKDVAIIKRDEQKYKGTAIRENSQETKRKRK